MTVASAPVIDRQVPLVVTITRRHVVWIDVDAAEDAGRMAECWIEEPYDLLDGLTDANADDIDYTVQYDPALYLVARAEFIGPCFSSGAWSQAEEDRYQRFVQARSA